MKLNINYDSMTATTDTQSITVTTRDELTSILYKAVFSNNVTDIEVVNTFFITSKIVRACKVALVRNVNISINDHQIVEWTDLRPYIQELQNYIEQLEEKEESSEVLTRIIRDKQLLNIFLKGIDVLHTYLDDMITNSGYDISPFSSVTSYDKKSSGTYEDRQGKKVEYSLNYTPRKSTYHTSLLDKLKLRESLLYYESVGLPQDAGNSISTEDIDSYTGEVITDKIRIPIGAIVTPVSACEESVQMFME